MKSYWRVRMILTALFLSAACGMGYGVSSNEIGQTKPPQLLFSSQYPAGQIDPSLANEAAAAIRRGLDWLAARQREDGSWSDSNFPALTALPLWAFANSEYTGKEKIVKGAVRFITSCVQTNGGIYRNVPGKGGGLANYNTAICMTALNAAGDPALGNIIRNARSYVAGSQHLGDDMYYGGMGYDRITGRAYADGINTLIAAEAMRLTQGVEDLRPKSEKRADLDWAAARKFVTSLQNTPEAGPDDAGGFKYRPDESKAGTTTNKAGVVVLRSFGSMTYVGLLALIYADVGRDDPRVQSAFQWSKEHWTLDENPGMGTEGLFFFYNVLSKSLAAYGRETIPLKEGRTVAWRAALVKKLVGAQKTDADGHGYWVNDNNRFWESNPVLTTAYSVLALQIAAAH